MVSVQAEPQVPAARQGETNVQTTRAQNHASNTLALNTSALAVSLPTNQSITPEMPPGAEVIALRPHLPGYPNFSVGQAISEALSPDGNTLAVLTTGYNKYADPQTGQADPNLQNEYVLLYDIRLGRPVFLQSLTLKNTWAGITFSPDGLKLYVSGGVDDVVHVFEKKNKSFVESSAPIALNHDKAVAPGNTLKPIATGLALTRDGKTLVVANLFNDSITVVDTATQQLTQELDLRPGLNGAPAGTSGGTYPFWVVVKGNQTAYVSSLRDREIVVVDLLKKKITQRIPVLGNPNKMILNAAQDRLYVALDNSDSVALIETENQTVLSYIKTVAPHTVSLPAKSYTGAAPNSLALSRDEKTLYVTNNGTNSVAVIALSGNSGSTQALIPTPWSPEHIVYSHNAGGMLYVVNNKGVAGPNTGQCLGNEKGCLVKNSPVTKAPNQYVLQLSKASLQSLPVPRSPKVLSQLTHQVALNNHFGYRLSDNEARVMAFLHEKIKHVIYIVRENRTFDQVLGDLGRGKGQASLTEFPKTITTNQHALAQQFVVLDNFFDPGEVSGNGWPWSVSARESDFGVKMLPPSYARRGGTYDWEGQNRNVFVGSPVSERSTLTPSLPKDPNIMAGYNNVAAPDGPNGERQRGYLWSSALRAGLTVRNYGFFTGNLTPTAREGNTTPYDAKVAQVAVSDPELQAYTDVYFRGFDPAYPELYREREWEREFNEFVLNGDLPALSLVRFGQDHTGGFAESLDGVDTPETQVAANDYAIGKLVEAVSRSPYAANTLIFVVEDDSQSGPDHVDSHRSIAFILGPYVRQGGAVVHQKYTTVNMLRTMEDVLGMDYLSVNDSNQAPMTEVFDLKQSTWSYQAVVPPVLYSTRLALPGSPPVAKILPKHNAQYWARVTRGMDFSKEDRVDAMSYNKIMWRGLMKGAYPRSMLVRDRD
jgi:DNA-binding beta-propeller fold protein YncE